MHSCHAIGCRPLTKPAHPRQLIRPARKKPAGQTGGPRLVKRESTSIHGAAGWALSRGDTIRDRARGASKWGFWSKAYGETSGTTPRPPTESSSGRPRFIVIRSKGAAGFPPRPAAIIFTYPGLAPGRTERSFIAT